ncbi:AAA family ATPase [Roseiflexus sp. RS-1]|jgi:hypothetical protein|uniref:AAA family ATPase n=1 Tax=Roseiflexus sp. (strain RS-1) TaxID=357808 RepID=UPI0000D801C9|nr:ATP-binding protein [Roseiflexus sp. RS-1]ABQ90968.1 hypothetical protein RoseRS_2592 [Roseiflexus sp. RS-1]
MIRSLTIHRFRGIREGVIKNLRVFNVLIGPNNSGKSALLELLYLGSLSRRTCQLITKTIDPPVHAATMLVTRDFLSYAPTERLRWRHGYALRETDSFLIDLDKEQNLILELPDLPATYPLHRFRLAAEAPDWLRKTDVQRTILFSLVQPDHAPPEFIPPLLATHRPDLPYQRWHYVWDQRWVYRWNDTHPLDRLAIWAEAGDGRAEHVLFFDFHTAHAHFEGAFAQRCYRTVSKWEERIAQSMARVFPDMAGMRVNVKPTPTGTTWGGYLELPDRTLPLEIDQFGDGARHAFKVLAALIALVDRAEQQEPGLFLWEDPELFMHPATLGRLLDEVARLVAGKPVQVFMSTQSLEVIAHVTRMLQHNVLSPEQTLAFRLNLRDGVLRSSWFNRENLASWLESGLDPRVLEDIDAPLQFQLREEVHEDPSLC